MSHLSHNYRQAYSSLRKKRGYSSSVILTIGITLGVLLCVLTLNHLLLIEPLTYPEQEKLFLANHVQIDQQGQVRTRENSTQSILTLYRDDSIFSDSAILTYSWNLIETHPAQPLVNIIETVPEYFKLFSVPMIKGRGFEASEAINQRNPVAVISYSTWQTHFNKSANILNKKIALAGMSYRIIGVVSADFVEPQIYQVGRKTEVWLPWDVTDDLKYLYDDWTSYDTGFFVGKLKSNISSNQAEQILTPMLDELWQARILIEKHDSNYVERKDWTSRVELTPMVNAIIGDTRSLALLMLAAVIGLVIIASSNVINLLMARTVEIQKQLAIYAALGAKKKHLYQVVFSEITILMFAATLLAIFIAYVGFGIMQHYFNDVLPRVSELNLDLFTLTSGLFIMLSLSIVFAKISIAVIDYQSLNSVLASSGKGTAFQVSKLARNRLIILQVAISSLLLFASINLGIKSLEAIFLTKGFTSDDLYQLYLPPNRLPFPDAKKRNAFVVEIKRLFSEEPVVETISHSSHIYNAGRDQNFIVLDINEDEKAEMGGYKPRSIAAKWSRVDQQYFSMIGQSIRQGDNFSLTDIDNVYREKSAEVAKNENRVAIVNQAFAQKIQPDGQVLGRLINLGRYNPYKIIGVVKNSIRAPLTFSEPRVFTPSTESGFAFIIKFRPGLSLSREKIVALVKQAGSGNPPYGYESLSEVHQQRLFTQISTVIVTTSLSVILVFLIAIGLYGIINYGTQMRRFELGTRLAIGAKRRDILRLILKENSISILTGLTVSLFAMLTFTILTPDITASFSLPQLTFVFIATIFLVGLISVAACYLPLRPYINRSVIYSLRGG